MVLFVESFAEALSFAVPRSFGGVVVCSSICLEALSVRFLNHLEALSLQSVRFNHAGVFFVKRHCLSGSEALSVRFLNHLDVLCLWLNFHHHNHDHCTMIKRWRDAPSICVGREVIDIFLVELERKTRKK
jgi:hypothetical protein